MSAPHRILLVPEARPAPAITAPRIRRYSLARVRLADARDRVQPKFAHLRRAYD
jgi:hypothetical protein